MVSILAIIEHCLVLAANTTDLMNDGDWQAVGSKKGRPNSAKSQPMSTSRSATGITSATMTAAATAGANFEQMVVLVQDKYQLTR